jgi:hypothetical protein
MSHHLDSPIARQDIRLDITDLYVFLRGEKGTVFAMNVCHSIFGAIPVPGYHPEGMYEFKVDLNGDAIEDVTYRLTLNERDEQGKQAYTVRRIAGADAVKPEAAGTVVALLCSGSQDGTVAHLQTTRPMFSLAANTPVSLGIGMESVTSKPSKTFPYVPAAGESMTAGA